MKKLLGNLNWKHILLIAMILSCFIPTKADNMSFGLDFIYETYKYQLVFSLLFFIILDSIFSFIKK